MEIDPVAALDYRDREIEEYIIEIQTLKAKLREMNLMLGGAGHCVRCIHGGTERCRTCQLQTITYRSRFECET